MGHIPWNKGKTNVYSEETKKNISETLKRKGIKPRVHFTWKGKTSEKHRKASKLASLKLYPPVILQCEICFKDFRISPRRKSSAHYCSRKCQSESQKKSAEHKVKVKNLNREARRAREVNAQGSFTLDEWETLKAQYNWTCPCCQKSEPFNEQRSKSLTIDHIVPLQKGGSHNIQNIQPLCIDCNIKKHTKVIKYEMK